MLSHSNTERAAEKRAQHVPPTLYDAALHISCRAVGANYTRRTTSKAHCTTQALRDLYATSLTSTWCIEELSAVIPPQLRGDNRPIFAGQTRADGKALKTTPTT